MEKIFQQDRMSKRERVEATLNHHPVDRAALLEQLSYNPRVIADWTGKTFNDFDFTIDDICEVIRKTMDLVMPPVAPRGTARVTSHDGFVSQHDNWTTWHVGRPFSDPEGGRDWLMRLTGDIKKAFADHVKTRTDYHARMKALQTNVGDTVILDYSHTGFCGAYDSMGLEIFTFFQLDYPEVLKDYMEASVASEIRRIHAIADQSLSPVILVPEDFATKQGSIFAPPFLNEFHFPYLRQVATAWHEHDIKVLYHSDGNWRKHIPDLINCGVDGFYCIEKNCGMDIVEFKKRWPAMVWGGGVDGVDLMEFGTPGQVRDEVIRQIVESDVLRTGGMFVASSSEINPPIPPENFRAMIEAVGMCFA